jgi:hypothetical protein
VKMIQGDAATQAQELLRVLHEEAKDLMIVTDVRGAQGRQAATAFARGRLRGAAPCRRAAARRSKRVGRQRRQGACRRTGELRRRQGPPLRRNGARRVRDGSVRARLGTGRQASKPWAVFLPYTAMGRDLAPRIGREAGRGSRLGLRRARSEGRPPGRARPMYSGKATHVHVGRRAAARDAARERVRAGQAGLLAQGGGRRGTVDGTLAPRSQPCMPRAAASGS